MVNIVSKAAASPFSWAGLKRNWSLMPVVGFVGAACVLCAGYVTYMCTTKPDVWWDNRRMKNNDWAHNDVGPSQNKKLYKTREIPATPEEVLTLRKEVQSYKAE